jgi:hypothetical protein
VAAFNIEFDVPCGVASCSVTICSNVSWPMFIQKISGVMGCSYNTVPALGYVPSWKLCSKVVAKILDGSESFEKLVAEIQDYIREQKAKNRGKGVVKAWSIHLRDLFKEETGKVCCVPMSLSNPNL